MSRTTQTRIVILGAGFAGVACARALARSAAAKQELAITLVDARSFHLYHPSLYEVLTRLGNHEPPRVVRETTTITLAEIFRKAPIELKHAHVKYWDADKREVHLDTGILPYDTLVLALGSTSEYFGVPGAQEFGWPFKSFEDAMRFRNALVSEFRRPDGQVTVVISGGGFTGVETAGELAGLTRHLEQTNNRDAQVVVVEGCPQLLPGMDGTLAKRVKVRLERLGVEIRLNTLVKRVRKNSVELATGEEIQTQFVLWTAGVRACPLPGAAKELCGAKGRISVDRQLRVAGHRDVYAIGDIACVAGADGKPLPQTAAFAVQQGKYVAKAILDSRLGKTSVPFQAHFEGYVVPVGGKYAFFVTPSGLVLEGFFAWLLRRFVDLAYLASVLPWWRALTLWLRANRLFTRND